MYDPLGLSIGTTNLVAARHGSVPVTRRAVLTLYPHCAPKVGVGGQESNGIESGELMCGFVERVGGRMALTSSDGAAHDPDLLMVEALDAMVVAGGADASSSEISIAVPAYWKPATVQALRNALRTHVGFVRSGMAPRLVSDAVAAATAASAEVELPDEGMVGVLDFGGSGASVTLLDTKANFQLASATMRYVDFSGDEIDQALLLHVLDELGRHGDLDPGGTAAYSELGPLREACRAAKERLSTAAVTELAVDLPGCAVTIPVTRGKLEELIQDPLTGFIYAFDDMMARTKGGWAELTALVTVGGGGRIPLVAERLSLHTRRPVLTVEQPAVAGAAGALALAIRGDELDHRARTSIGLLVASAAGTRVIEAPPGDVMVIDQDALTERELAWSQTDFGDVPIGFIGNSYNEDNPAGYSMRLNILEPPKALPRRRFQLSQLLIGACAVVAMTAIGGVAITLAAIENRPAQRTPAPTVVPSSLPALNSVAPSPLPPPPSVAPPPSEVAPPSAPPEPPPPPPSPVPPPVEVTTVPPPVHTHTTAPRMTTTTPPPPPTTTVPPAATTTPPPPPTTTTTVEMTTQWIHVPLLPLPIPVPVPKSQAPQNPNNGGNFQNPFQSPGMR